MVHKYKKYRKIPVPNFFGPKNHFQPIKNERMSLKKSRSPLPCLCLSLSLTSLLSRPVKERKPEQVRVRYKQYIPNEVQYSITIVGLEGGTSQEDIVCIVLGLTNQDFLSVVRVERVLRTNKRYPLENMPQTKRLLVNVPKNSIMRRGPQQCVLMLQ